MKKEKIESNGLDTLQQPQEREEYVAPAIEVVEIELEQNVLSSGSGDLPGFGGEDW